jgi:hypothetical protein
MKNLNIIAVTLLTALSTTTFASDKTTPEAAATEIQTTNTVTIKEPAEFQKIIDEYKDYVAKVPVTVRDEVIAYRKEIAKINKEKKLLYKKLSQESQDYLKKEQEYKKRLPLNKKALINTETPGEKVKTKE